MHGYKRTLLTAAFATSALCTTSPLYSQGIDRTASSNSTSKSAEPDAKSREAQKYFRRGIAHRSNANFSEAQKDFSEVIKLLPEKLPAYMARGHIYMALNEPLKAISDFDTVLKLDPKAFHAHFNKASCYLQADKPEQAIAEYTKCLEFKLPSTNALNCLMHRGRIYLMLNRPQEAIKDFTRALTIDSKSHLIYMFRGRAYQLSGNLKRAREDLELANLNEEEFATSHYTAGIEKLIKQDANDFDRYAGKKKKVEYLSYDDRTKAALEKKDRKDFKGALEDLNEIIDKQKNLIIAYIIRGDVYLDMGEYDAAIKSFSQAWLKQNMNQDAIHGRVRAYLAKNDPVHALPDINKLIWFDPFCPNHYFEKAQTLEKLKRNKEASATYKRFLELAEQNKRSSGMPITKYRVPPEQIAIAKKKILELTESKKK